MPVLKIKAPCVLSVALALAMAGCSPGTEPASEETVAASVEAAATESAAAREDAGASAQPEGIPASLQGRWGLVPADCTSERGDAKGLIEVGPDSITFYESVAKLARAKAAGADSITSTFGFSGEGESWVMNMTIASPDGGRTMVRTDEEPQGAPAPLTYTKCP